MDIVVIGNGFDLAHKLKTSYSDFQTYLYDEYQLAIDDFDDCFPVFISDSDGGNYVPLDIAAALLYSLITNADGISGQMLKTLLNTSILLAILIMLINPSTKKETLTMLIMRLTYTVLQAV